MIVLDEHLKGRGVVDAIAQWYRGRVRLVTDLRPGTLIKDDGIPALLRTVPQPTFVTLNWNDFWQRAEAHEDFCIVCFTLPTNRAAAISPLLRRLFRLPAFKTKSARTGKVARVSGEQVAYYQAHDSQTCLLPLP